MGNEMVFAQKERKEGKILTNIRNNVIEEIIRCNAVVFEEVTLKSGRISPYFLDVGKMLNPTSLEIIGEAYARSIVEVLSLDEFDGLFGPSYKGIPLAVATSFKIKQIYGENKPVLYDRKETKAYGVKEDEKIIGGIKKGSNLIIIDDVLTTGLTKLKLKKELESLGYKVIAVVVLMDRNEKENCQPASDIIRKKGLKFKAIIEAVELFQILWDRREELKIQPTIFQKIKEYYEIYGFKKLSFEK
jgi:orotate phosphoribosyltransferase